VLAQKIAEIKLFLTDADIDVALNIANATPLTTQQLNRALKSIIRQLRRSANLDVRAFRYVFGQVHPELLDDVSDAAI
jgi:ribosomal protein L16/L10AE